MTAGDVSAATPLEVRRTLAWMVASCLLFALVMVCVRLFLVDLPPIQTVFMRYVVGILLLMPLVAGSLRKIRLKGQLADAVCPRRLPCAGGAVLVLRHHADTACRGERAVSIWGRSTQRSAPPSISVKSSDCGG